MSFDNRDIRRTMDVYTLDNHYLGTVLEVIANPARVAREQIPADALQSSAVSGELLGPMPTLPIGNLAPERQSASQRYATAPDGAPIGDGALWVGHWWGLRGQRRIPIADVQAVSLERVVLRLKRAEIR